MIAFCDIKNCGGGVYNYYTQRNAIRIIARKFSDHWNVYVRANNKRNNDATTMRKEFKTDTMEGGVALCERWIRANEFMIMDKKAYQMGRLKSQRDWICIE